jgi:hypothetical protein
LADVLVADLGFSGSTGMIQANLVPITAEEGNGTGRSARRIGRDGQMKASLHMRMQRKSPTLIFD